MKRALVLGGGGARGAYELGVWQAMEECNITVDIVCGTSIGALNGALFVQSDYAAAEEIWNNLDVDDVIANGVNLDFDLELMMRQKERMMPFLKQMWNQKNIDISPFKRMIDMYCDEEAIRQSDIDFGLCTVEVPRMIPRFMTKEEIPRGQMKDFLLASAACFPVFPMIEIAEKYYIDGGYHDNIPIALAQQMGAEEYIVVSLNARYTLEKKWKELPYFTYIQPYVELSSFLNFDQEVAKQNIRLGYLDAMKAFGQYTGYAYAFTFTSYRVYYNKQKHPLAWITQSLLTSTLKSRAIQSLLKRAIGKRMGSLLEGNEQKPGKLFMRMAEITGEVLGLRRDIVYETQEFHKLLWEQMELAMQEYETTIQELLREYDSLETWKNTFHKLSKKMIICFLFKHLQTSFSENDTLEEYMFLFYLQSDELLAAFYLLTQQHQQQEQKILG